MAQKVTVEVEVKPKGDLSEQKAQADALAKSLAEVQKQAKSITVPAKPAEPPPKEAAKPAAAVEAKESPPAEPAAVVETRESPPAELQAVVAAKESPKVVDPLEAVEPKEPPQPKPAAVETKEPPQPKPAVVETKEPPQPKPAAVEPEPSKPEVKPSAKPKQASIQVDPVAQFEAARERLNRSISTSGMDQEELQLFDLANLGLADKDLREIAGLWKTLKDSQIELKVQGFEEAAKRKIDTGDMTDDEVRLFDLKNLGATEEQLQAVKNLQEQIKTANVEVKITGMEKDADRDAKKVGMTPEESQIFDMKELGATEQQLERIRELQKEIQAANIEGRVQSFEQGVEREVKTSGMNQEEVQLFDLQAAGASEQQLERIRDLQGKRTENGLAESIKEVEEALRKQIATMGMSADEAQIWALKQKGATDTQLETVGRLQKKRQQGGNTLGKAQALAGAATSVVGAANGLAGSVLGGAVGGAQTGFAIAGVGGAAAGMAIGAATSAAGSVFGALQEGIEMMIPSSERFQRAMGGMADSMLRSESIMRRLARGSDADLSAFSAVSPASKARILDAPEADRPRVIREERDRERREYELMRASAPFMVHGSEPARIAWSEGMRAREASLAVLDRGVESGIDGVTRDESRPSTISDASSVYDSIAMMIGGRAPAERTADAVERIWDEMIRWATDLLATPAPVP